METIVSGSKDARVPRSGEKIIAFHRKADHIDAIQRRVLPLGKKRRNAEKQQQNADCDSFGQYSVLLIEPHWGIFSPQTRSFVIVGIISLVDPVKIQKSGWIVKSIGGGFGCDANPKYCPPKCPPRRSVNKKTKNENAK